jgi:hypothetical protein
MHFHDAEPSGNGKAAILAWLLGFGFFGIVFAYFFVGCK